MQKNGKHGEVKRYTCNIRTPSLDAIPHWIVILEQFDRLVGLDNKQQPLAIYYDYDKKKTMNICSNDSKRLMQNTVCLEYGITNIKELSKWTNHSIRVGMACLLQSQGKAGDYIQRALRW
jgi:ribosomal protein L32